MHKQLIVFLAYSELDIIKTSFNSILRPEFDYFIVENKSTNSERIADYFIELRRDNPNILGYIQYSDNIAASAIDYFIQDFNELLCKYDYISITDGDFYMYDICDAMKEVRMGFNYTDCIVSSVKLYEGNNYGNPATRVVGTDHYIYNQQSKHPESYNPVPGITSNCFITFKPTFLEKLKEIHYIDTTIYQVVESIQGRWYITTKNEAYHLTWDLYIDDHPYFEWKKAVIHNIWDIKPRVEYKQII